MGQVTTVRRRINYYQLTTAQPGGEAGRVPVDQDFGRRAVEALAGLDRGAGEHYLTAGDQVVIATGHRTGANYWLRLGYVRRSDLPLLEKLGAESALTLATGEGILEVAHLVFFPNGVLGAEYNFRAPRVSRLRQYLRAKCPGLPRFRADLLMNEDAVRRLSTGGTIERVELGILTQNVGQVVGDRQNEPVLDVLTQAARSEAAYISLGFGHEPHRRGSLPAAVRQTVMRLARTAGLRSRFRKFTVDVREGDSTEATVIDLLEDELVHHAVVAKLDPRSSAVVSNDIVAGIVAGRERLLPEINRARQVILEAD